MSINSLNHESEKHTTFSSNFVSGTTAVETLTTVDPLIVTMTETVQEILNAVTATEEDNVHIHIILEDMVGSSLMNMMKYLPQSYIEKITSILQEKKSYINCTFQDMLDF